MEIKPEIVSIKKPLTPTQKAQETRRRNNLEKQVIAASLKKQLKKKYKVRVYDPETDKTEVVIVKGEEMIGQRMMQIATGQEFSASESIKAAEFIRDSIGEKPTERRKVEGNVTFAWEQMVDKIRDDE